MLISSFLLPELLTYVSSSITNSGKIHYMDMFALLKQIDPPLGFGSKCPDLLSYKRLVRMNMPVDIEGKVHFTTTLFALVRVNLQIFVRSMDEMDQADQELRSAIGKGWPFTKRDGKLDLLVPPPEGEFLPINLDLRKKNCSGFSRKIPFFPQKRKF